jgi:hypothetical protein
MRIVLTRMIKFSGQKNIKKEEIQLWWSYPVNSSSNKEGITTSSKTKKNCDEVKYKKFKLISLSCIVLILL